MGKKTIFLTGASGFIGRNLLEKLSGRYEILAPSSAELDLLDTGAAAEYLKAHEPDAVINAAARGVSRKDGKKPHIFDDNLGIFMNIASCSGHFGRMIQLGSGAEYDKSRPLIRVREDEFGRHVPADEYGRSKYACSKHIELGGNITCLRLFACYGKYEDYEVRFISNAICKAIFGLPITIANRNVVFSYLYVDDLARIVDHFIRNDGKHRFYNAVSDERLDLLTIANKVRAVAGGDVPIVVKNEGMNPEYTGDNSRLKEEIPGFKFTSLDEGIKKLYAWYAANKERVEYGKLAVDRY